MDSDADGHLDIIVGCFEGFVYLIKGKGKGEYEKPVRILDVKNQPVNQGQYWDYDKNKWHDGTEKGSALLVYPFLADWDSDGDLDLILGGYNGKVGVKLNNGTKEKAQYASENLVVMANKAEINLGEGVSPVFVDWDGDGLKDLVCGSSSGKVNWYKNKGSKGKPEFGAAINLYSYSDSGPKSYLKIQVADINGDGKLDLIVGGEDKNRKGVIWLFKRE